MNAIPRLRQQLFECGPLGWTQIAEGVLIDDQHRSFSVDKTNDQFRGLTWSLYHGEDLVGKYARTSLNPLSDLAKSCSMEHFLQWSSLVRSLQQVLLQHPCLGDSGLLCLNDPKISNEDFTQSITLPLDLQHRLQTLLDTSISPEVVQGAFSFNSPLSLEFSLYISLPPTQHERLEILHTASA